MTVKSGGKEKIFKLQKKIVHTTVDKATPDSRIKVTGEKNWRVFSEMLSQGATAFRLFRHDTEVT